MADVMTAEGRSAVLAERYRLVRGQTERLASPLSPEDQTVQSMPDVSPTKWHRAHTSWFFETFLLEPGLAGYRVYDPHFGYLFNSYYESVGARYPRPQRGLVSRPGAGEISAYRSYVDDAMGSLLDEPMADAQAWLVELGLHHEQQHQELLLMDIKHVLSCSPLLPAYLPRKVVQTSTPPAVMAPGRATGAWFEHAGGRVETGFDGAGFSFDNETPRHAVQLVPFALSKSLVTCGEWLAFMADDGYKRPELWLSDGWTTIQEQRWEAPLYWFRDGGDDDVDADWQVFTLHGPKPVDAAEPVVHVSYYEADAYARWSGKRLPTEAEWESIAESDTTPGRFLPATGEVGLLHPQSGSGMQGETWQWTASPYTPYPGFAPAPGAVGEYNGKFMVNQMVLRGGCCVTPADHVRPTYRNFFPPHARWAFSGVRLAADR